MSWLVSKALVDTPARAASRARTKATIVSISGGRNSALLLVRAPSPVVSPLSGSRVCARCTCGLPAQTSQSLPQVERRLLSGGDFAREAPVPDQRGKLRLRRAVALLGGDLQVAQRAFEILRDVDTVRSTHGDGVRGFGFARHGLHGVARPRDLVGAQARRDLLEHAVDEAVALGAAEALAELDRLVQHHLEGRFGMRDELERADVENRALHRR